MSFYFIQRFHAYKHHWSDTRLPVLLEITPYSLDQLDPTTSRVLASYYFKDFEGLAMVSDYPGGFVVVCGGFGRLHLFQATNVNEIKQKLLDTAQNSLGITLKVLKDPITLADFQCERLGKFR